MRSLLKHSLFLFLLGAFGCDDRIIPEPKVAEVFTTPDTIKALYLEVTSDTIIKNLYASGTDYRIMNMWNITNGATLTIEAGVNLQVVQDGGIHVSQGAALKISGTASDPVIITGQSKTKGFWKGIVIENTFNANNKIDFANIEYAGGAVSNNMFDKAAVALINAKVELNDVKVRYNKVYGVSFDSTSVLRMERCTIAANDSNPILATHLNFNFYSNNCDFTGNINNQIYIHCILDVTAYNDQVLASTKNTFYFDGTAKFASNLTIYPTRIVMGKFAQLHFDNTNGKAALIGFGNSTDKILIEGQKPDSGYWQGIVMHKGGNLNLSYCHIKGAGTATDVGYNGYGGSIIMSYGLPNNLSIENCTIENSFFNGIIIDTPNIQFNSNILTANTFINIKNSYVLYY
jgi:hypothetical protein